MRLAFTRLLSALLLVLTSCSAGRSVNPNLHTGESAKLISQASFCDAYVFRDADKRDHRPSPEEELYPFMKDSHPGNSILGKGDSVLDVAAVASRVTAQARVSKEQVSRFTTALNKTDSFHPTSSCYSPHHAVVFYSEHGEPLCCIEICFSCNAVKTAPQLRTRIADSGQAFVEGADLVEMAKIFEELKLPLTPYKSFDALKRDKGERSRKYRVFLQKAADERDRPWEKSRRDN